MFVKVLVAYHSESGNTQKLALAIAAGMGTGAVSIDALEGRALQGYDLICIGTPVQYGAPTRQVRDFISRMPTMSGKKGAAFCTMHMFGDKRTLQTLKGLLEAKGMVFLGGVSARGWSHLIGNFGPRVFNRGRPNREELARAEEFGRKLLAKM